MIYLDNAATTFPKPEAVYAAMDRCARTALANPGRAGHRMALESERIVSRTRESLQRLISAETPERIAFTLNCTDALNMAIKGVLRPGAHVVTTSLEHNSVMRPLRALERANAIALTVVDPEPDGFVDPDRVAAAMRRDTQLVVSTHASNVTGALQPVAEIGARVRAHGALFLVDAAQSAGSAPIDVEAMSIDLLAVPGHKGLLGPTGTGALYVGARAELRPFREGGTGTDSVSPVQPATFPHRLEAGTPNVLGLAGLTAGIEYVLARGVDAIAAHERVLVDRLLSWVDRTPYRVVGGRSRSRHVGAITLVADGLDSTETAAMLDASFEIAVRPGLHCAPGAHAWAGTRETGALRVSVGPFNTAEDIDALCAALDEIAQSTSS